VSGDRQVITISELDVAADDLAAVAGSLSRLDASQRLNEVVATTKLEGVYPRRFSGQAAFVQTRMTGPICARRRPMS